MLRHHCGAGDSLSGNSELQPGDEWSSPALLQGIHHLVGKGAAQPQMPCLRLFAGVGSHHGECHGGADFYMATTIGGMGQGDGGANQIPLLRHCEGDRLLKILVRWGEGERCGVDTDGCSPLHGVGAIQ